MTYRPAFPETNAAALAGLCKSVLASVDQRDLRDITPIALIELLERVLRSIATRPAGDIVVAVTETSDGVELVTCSDDQPFIVSALRALTASEGLELRSSMNAIGRVLRDASGKIRQFYAGAPESITRFVLKAPQGYNGEHLRERALARLRLARAMVRDFEEMKSTLVHAADDYAAAAVAAEPGNAVLLREAEGLMRWLCDESFVMISLEEYGREGALVSSKGGASVAPGRLDAAQIKAAISGETTVARIKYVRSQEDAPVHRSGKTGFFVFTRLDKQGKVAGALAIEGLFTYKALHTPPETIPYVRRSLQNFLANRDVAPASFRGKAAANAFNSLPLEFLLTEPADAIEQLTDRVLRAEAEGGSDVELRISSDRASAYIFVTLPRGDFSEELRLQIQSLLMQKLSANYADYGVYLDRYENAIIHYFLTARTQVPDIDAEALCNEILSLAKGWQVRLREALSEFATPEAVEALLELYEDAFNEEHKRRAGGERLRRDIQCLESVRAGEPIAVDLYVSTTGEHPGSLNLRLFSRAAMNLSRQLPVIVNFGLEVVDSYAREVQIPHFGSVQMHNFRLDVRRDLHSAMLGRREALNQGLRQVFAGALGDDRLNRLVSTSSLPAEDVEVLRALCAYSHQLRCPFPRAVLEQALVDNPNTSQAMVGVLARRFDPELSSTPEQIQAALATLLAELRAVTDFAADRALQAFAQIVRAVVRTNAFLPRVSQGPGLAFKIATKEIPWAPEPKPFREIWVYDPEFEGVHLRGGRVARGGLRFSDRPDDFRTEILGLMATQMVKNVVIVPVGAKGGFVLRTPPTDRAALRAAGDRFYRRFIESLLSVTDNVIEGKTVAPTGIRTAEEPDPYLVVAADKGTAHLSDTANSISQARHFWMDDAFASGGGNGYDHKATGITARGAWEAAKRNFRELGMDPEKDVITAIGVGDMSGDVFGNGLLRSKTVRLLAAFNHVHVFIDPDPDPARSFVERQRLFDKPGSAWTDYDAALISKGGGVFDRKAKELPLSPEARAMLGIGADESVSGEDTIRAILRMQVDLCWMGGIGTYVKATSESHADVGDKANDSVRVNGKDLRCRVFAEGANLAITERGRVEFAERGGSNYTAFLDNSGGVDTSDHEVNLKILFAPLLASGEFDREDRNKLLRSVQEEICETVIGNNRSQSRMVSYDVFRSSVDLWRYQRTQTMLAESVPFDRDAFAMPSDDELTSRSRKQKGLYKCEAAVLGAHAKMLVYEAMLAGAALPEWLTKDLVRDYFPASVVQAVPQALDKHLLRREIATTMAVNRIIDAAGASFFPELMTASGKSASQVAEAYLFTAACSNTWELLEQLYSLEDASRQGAVYRGMQTIQLALEEAVFDLLDLNRPMDPATIPSARELLAKVPELLPDRERAALQGQAQELVEQGIPKELASRIISLTHLDLVFDSIAIAKQHGKSPEDMLSIRLRLFARLGFVSLTDALRRVHFNSPSDGLAIETLTHQLDLRALRITEIAVERGVEEVWKALRLDAVRAQVDRMVTKDIDIAAVVLLDAQLRRIVAEAKA